MLYTKIFQLSFSQPLFILLCQKDTRRPLGYERGYLPLFKVADTPFHIQAIGAKMKRMGFRPPLCTYTLNWARRTSWRWWDEWNDTALQTQDSKFEPWRSEAEHATSRSRRFSTILNHYEWAGRGRNIFSLKLGGQSGVCNRYFRMSKQAALTTAPWPPRSKETK